MNETIDSVLAFWFGDGTTASDIARQQKPMWWGKSEALDAEIEERFSGLVDAVAGAELEHWRESANGLLAATICCDQFPRNIYRGTAKSFAFDDKALLLAQQAVASSQVADLERIQRVFIYLPYEHSEDLEMQVEAVRLFSELESAAPAEEKDLFGGYLDFARRHFEIIERFGRFPHRNEILGRRTTDEEREFLKQPGSSF